MKGGLGAGGMSAAQKRRPVRPRALIARIAYVLLNLAAIAGLFNALSEIGNLIMILLVVTPMATRVVTLAMAAFRTPPFNSRIDDVPNDYLLVLDPIIPKKKPKPVKPLSPNLFMIVAASVMAVVSIWGFLPSLGAHTHGSSWFIFPLFWGVFDLFLLFLRPK
jgi:fatty acid desaturase